jgi:hypothetical protein
MAASTTRATPEGTEFSISGNRVVFPDGTHEHGGGVALTDEVATHILAFPGSGADEDTQTEWEHTGESKDTRVGSSKVVEIRQTSFGRERTVHVTLVDIADATVEL